MAMAPWFGSSNDLISRGPDIPQKSVQYVVLLGIRSAQSRPEERRIHRVKSSSHWKYLHKEVGHPDY
jgi:hypothetical protein